MRTLVIMLVLVLCLAVLQVCITLFLTIGSGAVLSDFPSAKIVLLKSPIQRTDKGDYDYFELCLHGNTGENFYLRQPDQVELVKLLSALPQNGLITVHYSVRSGQNRLLDVRDESRIYFDLRSVIAEDETKRRISFVFAGITAALGIIPLTRMYLLGRRRRSNLQPGPL
jgi:hypothetical protein